MQMSLSSRLADRERELGRPVRIGLAGAGQMGMGFVAQVRRIPGMEIAAIADVLPLTVHVDRAALVDSATGQTWPLPHIP